MGQIMTTPHNPPSAEAVVPCQDCGTPTPMTGTKLCDGCWEHRRHCCIHSGLDKKPKAEPQPSAEREAAIENWRSAATLYLRGRLGPSAPPAGARQMIEDAVALMRSQPAAPQAPAVEVGKLAELREIHAEIMKERASRERGGADDCYTDNARSREREWRHVERMLALLAAPAGQEPQG